uniref:Putative product n=1 Tax=Xenopsylla cheopis TaxID=163159 RepID=A0A6M2DZS0_XENCH
MYTVDPPRLRFFLIISIFFSQLPTEAAIIPLSLVCLKALLIVTFAPTFFSKNSLTAFFISFSCAIHPLITMLFFFFLLSSASICLCILSTSCSSFSLFCCNFLSSCWISPSSWQACRSVLEYFCQFFPFLFHSSIFF